MKKNNNKLYVLGIDLAKNIFQLHGIDKGGKTILQKRVSRAKLLGEIGKLPQCIVAMEACGGAHHWGRLFKKMGHEVKLLNPQEVKSYVRGNKTDAQDAEAIAEAASRPRTREVSLKTESQQVMLSLHKIREQYIKERTALINMLRGLLSEFGYCVGQGPKRLVRELSTELLKNEDSRLPVELREEVKDLLDSIKIINKKLSHYDFRIEKEYKQDERCQRLGKIEGIGPITATALVAIAGNGSGFMNGRSFAAYLGLTPKEHSSGGKQRLLGISKRGNSYLRKQLVHGGRSLVRICEVKNSKRFKWLRAKKEKRGYNKAVVAMANKNARIAWALLSSGQNYRPAA